MRGSYLIICHFVLALTCCGAQADPAGVVPVLTINGIEEFIRAHQIQSVEQLLPYLPDSYLNHYTLLFHSRSLQSASFANPRALIYGSNGKLIMSFNGSPEQSGFDALELFEFNDLSKTFQLEEIQFPGGGAPAHFSEKNPEKCLRCHGENPHPLWDAPPSWPGSYGERYHEKLSAGESQGLYAYLRGQADHPRYRYLTNTRVYQDESTFYPSHHNIYEGKETEAPNAQLSKLLTTLNNEKIMQQVVSHPRFDQFRYALLASVSSSCATPENFFPPEWNRLIAGDYADFVRQDDLSLQRQQERKAQRSLSAGNSGSVGKDNSLRDFRYLAERALGIKTSEWSMALEKNTPDFTALDPIKPLLEKKLISRINTQDSNIMAEYYYRNYPGNNRYCAYLAKQNIRAAEGLALNQVLMIPGTPQATAPTDSNSPVRHPQQILQLCAACHTTGVAPPIEFDNPAILSARLNLPYKTKGTLLDEILYRISKRTGQQRMPPTVNYSDQELTELENYFRQLAAPQ